MYYTIYTICTINSTYVGLDCGSLAVEISVTLNNASD